MPSKLRARHLIITGLIFIALWLALGGIRIGSNVRSLLSKQAEVEAIVEKGPLEIDPDELESLVLSTHKDMLSLEASTGLIIRIAPYFGWLPRIGPLLKASPELMTMATSGTGAAVHLFKGLKPALLIFQSDSNDQVSKIPAVMQIIEDAEINILHASDEIDKLSQARSRIEDVDSLPWRIRSIITLSDEFLPMAQSGLPLLVAAPSIMGMKGPRSYLIVAQNEDELRPTGGFISGAGLLHVGNGSIESLEFVDSYQVDDWKNKPYPFPPQPLYEYMGSELFLMRDANYWPNFPTSAEHIMELYTYGQDVPLDGVIAIDQHFLTMLLETIGPLYIEELDSIVTSENLTAEMRSAWELQGQGENVGEWIRQRKSFMTPMAGAFLHKIENELSSINIIQLAQTLHSAAKQRHLQIYMSDPHVASVLSDAGWDGSQINKQDQDFLLVVDTNMGFNKTNATVKRSMVYDVALDANGGGLTNLEVRYNSSAEKGTEPCTQFRAYTIQLRYLDLINDCYWNYLRIYAPEGSQLVGASNHFVEGKELVNGRQWSGEAGVASDEFGEFTVFDNFVFLDEGQGVVTNFSYALPDNMIKNDGDRKVYELVANKQAGTKGDNLNVVIKLPHDTELIDAIPEPKIVNGQEVEFESRLIEDSTFTIFFR